MNLRLSVKNRNPFSCAPKGFKRGRTVIVLDQLSDPPMIRCWWGGDLNPNLVPLELGATRMQYPFHAPRGDQLEGISLVDERPTGV